MDDNENGVITLNEFFDLIDHIEKNYKFHIPSFSKTFNFKINFYSQL